MSAPTRLCAPSQARIEDLEWMARTGEGLHNAAARLGILPDSAKKILYGARRRDIVDRLTDNENPRVWVA